MGSKNLAHPIEAELHRKSAVSENGQRSRIIEQASRYRRVTISIEEKVSVIELRTGNFDTR